MASQLANWTRDLLSPYVPRPDKEREILGHFADADNPARLVTLRGAGGMGKTRLAIACALQAAVLLGGDAYGVRLENKLPVVEAVAKEIALAFDLAGEQATPDGLIAALEKRPPTLLLLDNFESVACEEVRVFVRALIHGVPGLRLLVTSREAVRLTGMEPRVDVAGMTLSEAHTLFLPCRERSGKSEGEAPEALDEILALTASIPLALELVAAGVNPDGSADIPSLRDSLRNTPRPELPPDSPSRTAEQRHPDLTRCLDWAIQNLPPEMQTDFARLGLFAESFTAETIQEAWGMPESRALLLRLTQSSLMWWDSDQPDRFRFHPSVRDFARERLKSNPDAFAIRQAFLLYYANLVAAHRDFHIPANRAALGREWRNAFGAAELAARLNDLTTLTCFASDLHEFLLKGGHETEATRLQELGRQLARRHNAAPLEANCVFRLGDIAAARLDHKTACLRYGEALALFSAATDPNSEGKCLECLGKIAFKRAEYETARKHFEEARHHFRQAENTQGEVRSIQNLGIVALRHFDYAVAVLHLEEALGHYRKTDDVQGKAQCLVSLGNIALQRSEVRSARMRYEEALPLFQRIRDLIGEADCTESLGIVALRCSDYDAAQERLEKALSLYRQAKSLLGEANCIRNFGDLALARSDRATALQRYEEALPLSRKAGDLHGQAYCMKSIGNIALGRKDYDPAIRRYEEALPLYRQVGDVLGGANCMRSIGEVALRRSEHNVARQRFVQALTMYERVSNPFSVGTTHRMLARIARNEAEKREHLRAAREAWSSIQRTDLVQQLEKEFGRSAAP